MKSIVLKNSNPALLLSTILLLSACGGGGGSGDGGVSAAAAAQTASAPPTTTGSATGGSSNDTYGPIKAQFTISAFSSDTPTNASLAAFNGSAAKCSVNVAGSNMCLGGTSGYLGMPIPSSGGKCIYLNIGPNQIPRGFDVLFRANDGRVISMTSNDSRKSLVVGDKISFPFGGLGLYQPNDMQWVLGGAISSNVTVTGISHDKILLSFDSQGLRANEGFGAIGSIALNGSAVIDCNAAMSDVK